MNLVDCFNFLDSIPDVIIGALIASVSAFFGVIITNIIQAKNVKLQLEHDSIEREKERILSTKQEIYLEAANAFARVDELISNIRNIDLSKPSEKIQLPELNNVLNRLHLIGKADTVKAAIEYEEIFGKQILGLFKLRIPIMKLDDDIVELENKISSFSFYENELNNNLQSIRIALDKKEIVAEDVKDLWEKNISELQETLTELKNLWELKSEKIEERNNLNFNYTFSILKSIIAISSPMTELILEMRSELGQNLNREFYIQARTKSIENLELFLDEYLSGVKKELTSSA